jgi:hypothetical protein
MVYQIFIQFGNVPNESRDILHSDLEYSNIAIILSNITCMFEFNTLENKISTLTPLELFWVLQTSLIKHQMLLLALFYFQ